MPNSAPAVPAINPSEICIVDGHATTTSLHVAEHFGKLHKDVLKRIAALDCTPDFHKRNFAPMTTKVTVGKGAVREEPAFRMTRDGFTFLCMGFTGKEAAKWKEAYINAFNQLEAELKQAPSRGGAVEVACDEEMIPLRYNRRPLMVYRLGDDYWYRASHVAAIVGCRTGRSLELSLPPLDVLRLRQGKNPVSWLSHRGLLASLGRLKPQDAREVLAWLQMVIPQAFAVAGISPTTQAIDAKDAGSLLRGMLAGTRFLCHLDDMGRVNLREIPDDHLIISVDRLPDYIADPCGPQRHLLPAILKAVSTRLEVRP